LKLSIITINLNNSDGLLKTFRSIISQTFIDFEFIIIDGCSSDNSVDFINQNSDKISYWISEPDDGIYHAMNKGIRKAKGEYCFFLNSGDNFADERVLEKVFRIEFHEDVVFGNLVVLFNNKIAGKSKGKEKISFLDVYASLIKHQAAFIRRELFDKFGLYNEKLKIVADWEFFLKTIGLGGASYKYVDIDISYFDNNGISNNSELIIANERKTVIEAYLPPMMQPDYELLLKFGKYEIVTKYRIAFLLLRTIVKGIKVIEKIVKCR
jgi:glycosyltransferase involved in cell wall biosynthesis